MNNKNIPYFLLPLKAVHLETLRQDGKVDSVASGFIRREGGKFFLYTNWHVVTGYDPRDLKVKVPPLRTELSVHLQGCGKGGGFEAIGGRQILKVSLYDTTTSPPTPKWFQDPVNNPHPDLNAINIWVPTHHDVVKIQLPDDLEETVSLVQVIDEESVAPWNGHAGEKVMLVGYPYGYSTMTMAQPTPVVLTRFIASADVKGYPMDRLLDGMGAKGMSGCPIFADQDGGAVLVGIYTGCLFPDHERSENNQVTALGRMSRLEMVFRKAGGWPLVDHSKLRNIP